MAGAKHLPYGISNRISFSYLYSDQNVSQKLGVFYLSLYYLRGFGGLGVSCWPLVPKFAGSNPAEAVGFLRAKKNPQHALLRRGSKAVGPMS